MALVLQQHCIELNLSEKSVLHFLFPETMARKCKVTYFLRIVLLLNCKTHSLEWESKLSIQRSNTASLARINLRIRVSLPLAGDCICRCLRIANATPNQIDMVCAVAEKFKYTIRNVIHERLFLVPEIEFDECSM